MRDLLDIPMQRRLRIIEQLNEAPGWTSSNELAKLNNASLRTINNDISYLKDNWYPHLLIETSKKNGVRLTTLPSSHVMLVYNYVFKNSDSFRLLDAIFFDTTKSIEKWGETLFISESSLYRIINELTLSLTNYSLTLEKKPCRIIGETELNVRLFFTSFFREAYSVTEWPYPMNKKDTIDFVLSLLNSHNKNIQSNQVMKLTNLVCTSLIRISQGFYIERSIANSIENKRFTKILEKSKPQLLKICEQLDITYDNYLITDLAYSLFYHRNNWTNEQERLDITKEIRQLIKTIRDVFDLTLNNKIADEIEDYLVHLYLFHKVYPYRNYIIFDKYYYSGKTIKNNFPFFSSVVEKVLKSMESNTRFPWFSSYNYVILYNIMVKWGNLSELLEEKKVKVQVLVISDLGEEHCHFLAEMIRKNFRHKINLTEYKDLVVFLDNIDPAYFNKYDLIITTFNTNILPVQKLIVIDDVPSNQDWATIRISINKLFKLSDTMVKEVQHIEEE
ncbi:helix-turn-helix domain-containing protein [Vagococcus vulneris]|uniref:Mga helix-turn-helix domain-containing protein n=1 Tax=Vagococcus vulneris TaxID=1977869 RepID=A0A429ZX38_9ENTE|nr:helix-turn-helix domain-containing protein [Vagococcus vulneris]RST98385.1 hypothetical protein CBF37_07680 [Vagococcus vulneris]